MKSYNIYPLALSLAALLFSCTGPSNQNDTTFDLILKGGTIYDGTGASPIVADVGITADTIAAIGELENVSAEKVVDVSGLAVAPGFINMLSWANDDLLYDGRSQGDIRQGVTLEVMGEGSSMGPLNEEMKASMQRGQTNITYDVTWNTLGEYLAHLEQKGVSTNVTSFVGNATLRRYVMGYESRKPTSAEMEEMKKLLREEMEAGAVGISSSLIYVPSIHADTEELTELARVAAEYDGMYISHMRNEGDSLLAALNELITIARNANIRAEVYHFKASGQQNWSKLDTAIAMIEAAQAEGLSVTTDMYNYPASSTGLKVVLPDWSKEGGYKGIMARLDDEETRQKVLEEIYFPSCPPSGILLVGFRQDSLQQYIGQSLKDVALARGKTPEETVIDLFLANRGRIQAVYFSMSEDNVKKKVALPYMSFCSDASSMSAEGAFLENSTHPRAYGSFARLIGHYVRDEQVIPLEEAIRKLTALPAENLKVRKRGKLVPGYFADVVVFDPEIFSDKATFEKPHQYAEGMQYVFVNGVQVINNGEHTGATPGRFVKGPGYKPETPAM
jgi:N-acyl-D-amino-acid deacylase